MTWSKEIEEKFLQSFKEDGERLEAMIWGGNKNYNDMEKGKLETIEFYLDGKYLGVGLIKNYSTYSDRLALSQSLSISDYNEIRFPDYANSIIVKEIKHDHI